MPHSAHDKAIIERLIQQIPAEHQNGGDQRIKWNQYGRVRLLGLAKRGLTTLPPEVGKLEGLEKLYLAGNQLTHLPAELGQLSQLRSLSLMGNPLG
ncbi:MAG TPA: leucine-rich repeat domain-containing protein [Ktedonobacterales bacterium]|nr:leucine-rich repeat domain-containing protein [Ktedonobacterales bacterium]